MIEHAKKNLLDFKKILYKNEVPFLLDGGTLLGAYRDGTFCKDDWDDIDLTTLFTHWYKVDDIINDAKKEGFEVYNVWEPQESRLHYNVDTPTSPQIALTRHGIKVDLMFKRIKGNSAWWTVFKVKDVVYKAVPSKFYSNVDRLIFLNDEFLIPKEINKYLTLRYGDWKTPIHRSDYSCYTSDNVIVESYEKI